jgi:hypothetical protein
MKMSRRYNQQTPQLQQLAKYIAVGLAIVAIAWNMSSTKEAKVPEQPTKPQAPQTTICKLPDKQSFNADDADNLETVRYQQLQEALIITHHRDGIQVVIPESVGAVKEATSAIVMLDGKFVPKSPNSFQALELGRQKQGEKIVWNGDVSVNQKFPVPSAATIIGLNKKASSPDAQEVWRYKLQCSQRE